MIDDHTRLLELIVDHEGEEASDLIRRHISDVVAFVHATVTWPRTPSASIKFAMIAISKRASRAPRVLEPAHSPILEGRSSSAPVKLKPDGQYSRAIMDGSLP